MIKRVKNWQYLLLLLLLITNFLPTLKVDAKDVDKKDNYQSIIATYPKTVAAGTEININDVTVTLLYESGKLEYVSGWDNLYFVTTRDVIKSKTDNKDGSISDLVETVTEESKTYRIEYGDNLIVVRLKDMNPKPIVGKDGKAILDKKGKQTYQDFSQEARFHITGTDEKKPIFLETSISELDVVKDPEEKKPVEIILQLSAKDNYSKTENLLYALKKKGEAVEENDFSSKKKYTKTVSENEIYVAYVKDEAGNIREKEMDIVIIDDIEPIIKSKSLITKEEDGWARVNTIKIVATDNYKSHELQYRFTLQEEHKNVNSKSIFGIWRSENEIEVTENGVYEIEVKDSVGNIAKTSISIKNVDAVGPEIENIEIKPIS